MHHITTRWTTVATRRLAAHAGSRTQLLRNLADPTRHRPRFSAAHAGTCALDRRERTTLSCGRASTSACLLQSYCQLTQAICLFPGRSQRVGWPAWRWHRQTHVACARHSTQDLSYSSHHPRAERALHPMQHQGHSSHHHPVDAPPPSLADRDRLGLLQPGSSRVMQT